MNKSEELRKLWEERGNKNIKGSNRPKRDIGNGGLESDRKRIENNKKRN
jgi:hypothetical protein